MTSTTAAPVAETGNARHPGWALVLISLARLMVVLDSTIANIALPFIGRDLDIDQAEPAVDRHRLRPHLRRLPAARGRLADLLGRRRIFMTGVLVFAAASLIGGTAHSELVLLAARALQGTGAAMASPAALALITTTFARSAAQPCLRGVRRHGRHRRGRRIVARWLADRPRPPLRHRGLALHVPDRRTDRCGRRLLRPPRAPGIGPPRRAARRPRRRHRNRRTALDRLRPDPRGPGGARVDRRRHDRRARPRRRAARRVRPDRAARGAPAAAVPRVRVALPQRRVHGDDDRARGDVRDVLLPLAVHAAGDGLLAAEDGPVVPAVLRGDDHLGDHRVAADQPGRPRFLSGTGTILSATALYGFHRLSVPGDPAGMFAAVRAAATWARTSTTGPTSCRSSC